MARAAGVRVLVAVGVVCAVLVGGCWFVARGVVQHRAEYPGGLIFVGRADGPLGVRYERFYVWKPPGYTDPLPALTVYIDDAPHPLAELTAEDMTALGGSRNDGGLFDAQGNVLRYRFEGGRPTYFSIDTANRVRPGPGDNVRPGIFRVSIGGGEPFALPATHRDLVRHAGKPLDTYWYFAN